MDTSENEIMCCYAHKDQDLFYELRKHLRVLERQRLITVWSDIDICPGMEWRVEINKHLDTAKFILLLISADFIHSEYCYSTEMMRAMERHEKGETRVIPIILRPAVWEETPFSNLQALPKDAKPVISWRHQDEAYRNITESIRAVVEGLDPNPLPVDRRGISRRLVIALVVLGGLLAASGTYAGFSLTRQTSDGRILYHTEVSPNTKTYYTVNYVQWSPKGNNIVTADGDMTVSVLDASTGKRQTTYARHTGFVDAAIWSPDGTEIASGSKDKTVQVWNAKNGNMRLKCSASFALWSVAWSPNRAYIASAGERKATQVWDSGTGKLISTYQGPTDGIWAIAWSHDSKRIAIGYTDGTIQVRSATDGGLVSTYHGQSGIIYEVMWSHHDDTIVSASKDHTVHIWNATDGAHRLTYLSHSSPVRAAEWSPDGTLIASSDETGVVLIWSAMTGTTVYTYRGHSGTVGSLTWSPDGKHMASGGDDGTIRIWDVQ